jgi:hypothetical protein
MLHFPLGFIGPVLDAEEVHVIDGLAIVAIGTYRITGESDSDLMSQLMSGRRSNSSAKAGQ